MSIYKPNLLDKFKDFVNGLKSNWDAYEGHVEDFETAKGIITDTFDETRTYAVGDYAIYENVLYKCVEAIEEAGEWDADKWAATNIAEEFESHLTDYASLVPQLIKFIPEEPYTGDCDELESRTIVRIINTPGPNAPGEYYYVWTMRYGSSGFQLAIGYTGGGRFKFRTMNVTWTSWKTLSVT